MKFDDFKSLILLISQERSQIKQTGMIASLFEDVINMDQESAKIDFKSKKLKELSDMINLINSGYAGIGPIGNICDMRIYKDAIPIKENKLLNIPQSKTIDKMKKGDKVKFIGADADQIKWGSNDDPNLVCNYKDVYEIDEVEIHSWHTKIRLVGIKGIFNNVSFENVEDI